MKKPNLPVDAKCVICGEPIKIGEEYEFAEQNGGKTNFFHTKCFENLKKKG